MAESAPVTLTERSVEITPNGSTAFCSGGMVRLDASAGTSWLWSNGATTPSLYATESGTYTVTATFADGCSVTSDPVVVDVRSPAAAITATSPTTVCPGTAIEASSSVTGNGTFTYQWYSYGQPLQGQTAPTLSWVPTNASGYVYLKVTDELGCEETSNSITYSVHENPQATITPLGATTFCQGDSVVLQASEGSAYSWSTGATTREITVTTGGTYSVTVTSSTCGLTSTADIGVTVNPLPAATVTALGPTTFCEGGSVTLRASQGATYLWSNGATTRDITVSASGSYSVTVSDGTCSATSSATTVTVNPLPVATVTALGPTTFCEGGSVTLRASQGTSYLWSNGATTRDITVSAGGSYTVTVGDGTCSATSAPTTVTVNPLPAATVTPLSSTAFCQGGSVTLRASQGTSYLWSNGATTRDITVTASGSFSVTVGNGTCSATSAPTTVTVNPLPAATITPLSSTTFCEGGSVTLRASQGTSYLWSTGAITRDIIVSASGSYTVTVSDGTCSATSAPAIVTVNPRPPATITVEGSLQLCPGASVTLRAPAGHSYLWSNGATGNSITVSAGGTSSVTVTGANGCSSTSSPVTVSNLPATTITTHPASVTIPRNDTRQLSVVASGAGTLQYQWYSVATDGTLTTLVGQTQSALTVGPYNKKGSHRFRVRVTSGTCTGSTVLSNIATVTVN